MTRLSEARREASSPFPCGSAGVKHKVSLHVLEQNQVLKSVTGSLCRIAKDIRVMVRAFTFRGFPVVDGDRFAIRSDKKYPRAPWLRALAKSSILQLC